MPKLVLPFLLSQRLRCALAVGGLLLPLATPGILQAATAPAITVQPAAVTVAAGLKATFKVVATGTATITYQWRKDGVNISGATAATYTTPVTTTALSGAKYQVYLKNSAGAITSKSALLTVTAATGTAAAITAQPASVSVNAGQTASFSVTATGTGTLAYQWKKNGSAITGATASTYTTGATVAGDSGASFQATVSNSYGSATSASAVLTVITPTPVTQPVAQVVTVPDAATFSVTASGNPTYQWQKNGVNITGATSATYTTPATTLGETSASFTVTVGGVTSPAASLTVRQPAPVYAGDPIAVPARPLNILSYCTTWSTQGAFRVGYDESLKNPLWSASCSYRVTTPLAYDNTRNFRADPRSSAGITDSDYTNTGFSRGHQTMLSEMGYRYGTEGANPTCFMTNISPQMQDQNGGIWNNLEEAATGAWNGTSWTKQGAVWNAGRLWLTTGPVFGANPATIGPAAIPVPVAFYKVMVKEVNGVPQALAVVIQHQPAPATGDTAKFITSVERLEELTGLNLFPALSAAAPATFKTTVDVRGWGAPFESTTAPNVHMVEPSWNVTAARGTTLTFRGAATSSNSQVASASWTFGDGTTGATPTAYHAYGTAGTYTVTYTAKDSLGVSSSIARVITVQ